MIVTEDPDLARLVREARDEDAAVAELEGCVWSAPRPRRADHPGHAASRATARSPADAPR